MKQRQSSLNQIVERSAELHKKLRSSSKPASIKQAIQLTAIISTIMTNAEIGATYEQGKSIINQLQDMLKCINVNKFSVREERELDDWAQLLMEVVGGLMAGRMDCSKCMISKLILYAVNIAQCCMLQLTNKKIIQILTIIWQNNSKQYIGEGQKIYLKYYVPLAILQTLFQNVRQNQVQQLKFYQVLQQFSLGTVYARISKGQSTLTQIENTFSMLFNILSTKRTYIVINILATLFTEYVRQFQISYDSGNKYIGTKFDPKIIGSFFKTIYQYRQGLAFFQKNTYYQLQDGQILKFQCNFCDRKQNLSKQYQLYVDQNIYNICCCQQCWNNFSNMLSSEKQAETNKKCTKNKRQKNKDAKLQIDVEGGKKIILLMHLALNSQKIQNLKSIENLLQILMINRAFILQMELCEHNKQLRLISDRLIRYVIHETSLDTVWSKMWTIIMIMTNNNHIGTRQKAIKVISDSISILSMDTTAKQAGLENNIIPVSKLKKCLCNRLYDTDQKIRVNVLNCLLYMIPSTFQQLNSIMQIIKVEYLHKFYEPTNSKDQISGEQYSSKNIAQLFDRLDWMLKDRTMQGRLLPKQSFSGQIISQKVQWFVKLVHMIVELAMIGKLVKNKEKQNQKKKRKNRKSRSKNKNRNMKINKQQQNNLQQQIAKQNQDQNLQQNIAIQAIQQLPGKIKQNLKYMISQYKKNCQVYQLLVSRLLQGENYVINISMAQPCSSSMQRLLYDSLLQLFIFTEMIDSLTRRVKKGKSKKVNSEAIIQNILIQQLVTKIKTLDTYPQRFLCKNLQLLIGNRHIAYQLILYHDYQAIKILFNYISNYCSANKQSSKRQNNKITYQSENNDQLNTISIVDPNFVSFNDIDSRFNSPTKKDSNNYSQNYHGCLKRCVILNSLLQQTIKHNIKIDFNSIQVDMVRFQRLLVTQLLTQANLNISMCDSINHDTYILMWHDMTTICRLTTTIDIITSDNKYTLSIYSNCFSYLENTLQQYTEAPPSQNKQETEEKVRLMSQTLRIMLRFIPQLNRSTKAIYGQNRFVCQIDRIAQIGGAVLAELVRLAASPGICTTLLVQYVQAVCQIWQLYPASFLLYEQAVSKLMFQYSKNKKIIQTIFRGMHIVLKLSPSISLFQKIRDMVISCIGCIGKEDLNSGIERWECILGEKFVYLVVADLLAKGLTNYYDVCRLIIYGIVDNMDGQFNVTSKEKVIIRQTCSQLIRQSYKDITESRQLFTNFNQTLKWITRILNCEPWHSFYFNTKNIATQMSISSILNKNKQEKSQYMLKHTLYKTLAQCVNKMALSGKLIERQQQADIIDKSSFIELSFICNTIYKTIHIERIELKILLSSLMAVVELTYFQVLAQCKKNKQSGDQLIMVMQCLAFLLNGVSYKQAYNNMDKYYKIRDQVVQIAQFKRTQLAAKKHGKFLVLEQLYDTINEGYEIYSNDNSQYYDNESETYDTSENTDRSNLKLTRRQKALKQGRTKAKKEQQKHGSQYKRQNIRTKKLVKNVKTERIKIKSMPKSSDFRIQEIKQQREDKQQINRYRKKLRNRNKVNILS